MKGKSIARLRSGWFDHLGLKALSLVLAVALFLAVRRESETRTVLLVRVAYRLPRDHELLGDHPSHLRITAQGPRDFVSRLDERELPPVEVDLREARSGALRLRPSMVHLAAPLRVVSIAPAEIQIRLEPTLRRTLPVRAVLAGEPAPGFRVGEVHLQPATVEIEGPARAVRSADAVETEPIRVAGVRAAVVRTVALLPPPDIHLLSSARRVEVRLAVARAIDERPLVGRPIEVLAPPGVAVAAVPAQADIVLLGPRALIDRVNPAHLHLQVELGRHGGRRGAGELAPPLRAAVKVTGVPSGVAAEVHPEWVELSLRRGH
jgi:YbbR domain-containing protein